MKLKLILVQEIIWQDIICRVNAIVAISVSKKRVRREIAECWDCYTVIAYFGLTCIS